MNVKTVESSFQENSPLTVPAVPLNEKLDSTLAGSMGWLNVRSTFASNGIFWSLGGSKETTCGRAVMNFHVEAAPLSRVTPEAVLRSGFKLREYCVPPN